MDKNDKSLPSTSINWYIMTYDKTPSNPYLIRNFC